MELTQREKKGKEINSDMLQLIDLCSALSAVFIFSLWHKLNAVVSRRFEQTHNFICIKKQQPNYNSHDICILYERTGGNSGRASEGAV